MYLHYLIPKVLIGVHITPIYIYIKAETLCPEIQDCCLILPISSDFVDSGSKHGSGRKRECKSIRDGNMVESLNLLFSPLVLEV